MLDYLDESPTITGCNWQVQNTGFLQILPTVEKELDFIYHIAGELHQMQRQLYAVKRNKYDPESMLSTPQT